MNAPLTAAQAYKNNQNIGIMTADPMRLVLMVYESGIGHLKNAKEYIVKNDIANRNKEIYKTQELINELVVGLDFDKGGELSKNLYSLYEYFVWRLNMAIVKNSEVMVQEVISRMSELFSAWKEVYEKSKNP